VSAITNGQLLETARLRRAVLEAVATRGEPSSLLELHDELRVRGIDILDTRRIYVVAASLVDSGCLTTTRVEMRRRYAITKEGRAELARPCRT
jgi:DNA-binding PadR family transcriptional regulator